MRKHLAGKSGLLAQILAWTVPPTVAAVTAIHQGVYNGGDAILFVRFGRILLSSQWDQAFSVSDIQAGPLQLALYGWLGGSFEAMALVLACGTALLVVAATRAAGVRNPALLGGAGLLAVAAGLTRTGYSVGHPADAVLPLVWIIAADQARRGNVWRAGLLVGLSAGLETWGILGVAVLAFAPRLRAACVGVLVAASVVFLLFIPFVLGGHFEMLSFVWRVRPPSPISLLVADGTPFGWPLRLVQAAIAVGAGVAVARLLRHSSHAVWAAPLAVVVARLQLDPLLYMYYLGGPQGPIFVGAAVGASRLRILRRRQERPVLDDGLVRAVR